jgi:transcriptional regulator with XRE-family HTH domain
VELAGGIALMSRKCGLSRGVIHKYLKGESEPSRPRLVALARAAGVRVEWLATGEGAVRMLPAMAGELPELDDDELLQVVVRRVVQAFPTATDERSALIVDRILRHVRGCGGTEARLVSLGALINAFATADESKGLSRREEELLLLRDPLFLLWRWRHGRGNSAVARREGVTPGEETEFLAWCEGLRTFSVDELTQGGWFGDGGGKKWLLRFLWRGKDFCHVEQSEIAVNAVSAGGRRGGARIHDRRIVIGHLGQGAGAQTFYMVGETESGRIYAAVFNGDETAHDGILLIEHHPDGDNALSGADGAGSSHRKAG